ncbi:OmpA family protein [Actibacterium lipolyticum]|uniref:Putative lipoprotein YiaD n=1 Tax=Actibacterium lipolyticum TaxID=1524263 RepID=A0A238JKI0_9RHOB|nr:OmpA family protein [Actibacterium lipolyticum]SMX30714.1 putative lipoprotein YiaD precursor [Actibacterium lipolyticum]
MKMRPVILASAFVLTPFGASAQLLDFPGGAARTAERVEQLASYRLPIGPWDGEEIQAIWAEGEVVQQAWQVRAEGITTLQMLAPLREQLIEQGFDILFECDANICGGFDFRYATDVLPEPAMHVDLGDYRFLSAQRMGDTQPEYISLLVSRSSLKSFIQVMRIGARLGSAEKLISASTKTPMPLSAPTVAKRTGPLAATLEDAGHVVLDDLLFPTGSSRLGEGDFPSLSELAAYLLANPDRKIVLVGHTDSEGGLDGNIALSRKRARSVMDRLLKEFGVPSRQVKAQGVGFLSPLASNLTDDGRTKNRRVEVILTSTQ